MLPQLDWECMSDHIAVDGQTKSCDARSDECVSIYHHLDWNTTILYLLHRTLQHPNKHHDKHHTHKKPCAEFSQRMKKPGQQ